MHYFIKPNSDRQKIGHYNIVRKALINILNVITNVYSTI